MIMYAKSQCKEITTKVRHEWGYFTEDEISQRKGTPSDPAKNLEKIWGSKKRQLLIRESPKFSTGKDYVQLIYLSFLPLLLIFMH